MKKNFLAAIALALTLWAPVALAGDQTISTATVWSGAVTVDGTVTLTSTGSLTIQPGTVVNFVGAGTIKCNTSGTFSAQGTANAPIQFTGSQAGSITGNPLGMTFSNCTVSGLAPLVSGVRSRWLDVQPRTGGFSMTNCTISDSGRLFSRGGTETVTGCDVRDSSEFWIWSAGGAVNIQNNKFQNSAIYTSSATSNIAHNAMVDVQVWAANSGGDGAYTNFVIEDNYIHNTPHGQGYGIIHTLGEIRNNVIRGCSWNMSDVGGHISGNVLEALSATEAAQRGDPTHEIICGPRDNSVIERNLLLNASYGEIMGIGSTLMANVLVRNNTMDARGSSVPLYLNHVPSAKATGLDIRNNLFLRTGRIYDEQNHISGGYADTISSVDYNCFAGRGSDTYGGTSPRFVSVQITGKVEGDDGFGMHDVMLPTLASGFNPASLVANPDFVDPYSDADMLAGTYSTAQLLSLYRQAYTPVAGSALINAGNPIDATDPAATYGQVDIGAIEAALLPGDANMDRKTDFKDYIVLEGNFGKTNATWSMGDFNGDGTVDFKDYIILEGAFGKSVPEPMSVSMLVLGGLTLLKRRK